MKSVAAAVVVACLCTVGASAQQSAENAALRYWMAFAVLQDPPADTATSDLLLRVADGNGAEQYKRGPLKQPSDPHTTLREMLVRREYTARRPQALTRGRGSRDERLESGGDARSATVMATGPGESGRWMVNPIIGHAIVHRPYRCLCRHRQLSHQ
jgi:hypothetical protein